MIYLVLVWALGWFSSFVFDEFIDAYQNKKVRDEKSYHDECDRREEVLLRRVLNDFKNASHKDGEVGKSD